MYSEDNCSEQQPFVLSELAPRIANNICNVLLTSNHHRYHSVGDGCSRGA